MRIIPLACLCVISVVSLGRAGSVCAQTDGIQVYDAAIAPTGTFNLTLPAARQSHQLFGVLDVNPPMLALALEFSVDAGLTAASDHWVLKLILSRDC
jgi:hypothetical protein